MATITTQPTTMLETISTTSPHLVPIQAAVQNYAWGLTAENGSLAAELYSNNSGAHIDKEKPYAELWIGTHPSGPATLANDKQKPLLQFLRENDLPVIPYLLKVLSVAKPLSIQAHPDKQLAKQLHASHPKIYKDDNHKPEMSVALTKFEGMCNFRPANSILSYLQAYPALASLCGGDEVVTTLAQAESSASDSKSALKAIFSNLMTSSEEKVQHSLEDTVKRVKTKGKPSAADQLFLRLIGYYPGDVGCFAAFLLNFVKINPGQAFFMAANEPHAYLKGQCVEIMATSDNVVRAGLTPKFKDVDTLINMLTYDQGSPKIWRGDSEDGVTVLYQPHAEEFQLTRYVISPGKTHLLSQEKGPGMIMCYQGKGRIRLSSGLENDDRKVNDGLALKPGSVYYMSNEKQVVVSADEDSDADSSGLVLFRAGVNQLYI